jgi:hypothetical protein
MGAASPEQRMGGAAKGHPVPNLRSRFNLKQSVGAHGRILSG